VVLVELGTFRGDRGEMDGSGEEKGAGKGVMGEVM
jgi:hypothetical protein